jgi:chromosome segregation ATPase
MDAPKPQDINKCPQCRALQSRLRQLESELDLKSQEFSKAVTQMTTNQQAKMQAEKLNEKFIEQCVREKTESQIELKKQTRLFAAKIEQIKVQAQNKYNELARHINQLKRQMTERTEEYKKRIAEVTLNSQHDSARYEQIITKLKTESCQQIEAAIAQTRQEYSSLVDKTRQLEQQNLRQKEEFQKSLSQANDELKLKSQDYEQTIEHLKQQYEQSVADVNKRADGLLHERDQQIASLKEQLERVGDKITSSAREKSRAEQLNQRLLEQCRMAKTGADVEIEMRTKEYAEKVALLKGRATSKLQSLADENARLKAQAEQVAAEFRDNAGALNRANVRIKSLERALEELKNTAIVSSQF